MPKKKRKLPGQQEGDFATTPRPSQFADAQKRLDIVEMRVNEGKSLREIAEHYGVSRQWIHKILQGELEKFNEKTQTRLEIHRKVEELRLDKLWRAIAPFAFKGGARDIEVALKIMDRRASMLGLDAPTRILQANLTAEDLTDAQLVEEARRLGLPLPAAARIAGEGATSEMPTLPLPGEEQATVINVELEVNDAKTGVRDIGGDSSQGHPLDGHQGVYELRIPPGG